MYLTKQEMQQMNNLKDADEFIMDLVNVFPRIREEVLDEDYEGLLTLQIGCFRKFTQEAIDEGEWNLVSQCFSFVNENIGKVEHKVENALYLSYLGKLNIGKGSRVEKLLPPDLKRAYDEIGSYHSTHPKGDKLNDFLKDL